MVGGLESGAVRGELPHTVIPHDLKRGATSGRTGPPQWPLGPS